MISRFASIVAVLLLVTVAFRPRNTRKDTKNFRSKIDGISFRHFLSRLPFVYFVCFVG
jgi:anti-sigma factor RsiW